MSQDTAVPDAFILWDMICVSHSFLGQELKTYYFIQCLIFQCESESKMLKGARQY